MKAFASILALSLHLPAIFLLEGGGVTDAGFTPSANMKLNASRINVSLSYHAAVQDFHGTDAISAGEAKALEEARQVVILDHPTQGVAKDGSSEIPESTVLAMLAKQADVDMPRVTAMPGLLKRSIPHYVPANELTRLPYPVNEIDVEQVINGEFTSAGQFDLTILIEENGMVADVIAMQEPAELQHLTERLKDLFRSARFMPGEVDGKAVKSSIQVTVVSEAISEQGN